MEYIIPAVSAIVVAIIEALATRDRSRRAPITNSSSGLPHELVGHYFVEVNN